MGKTTHEVLDHATTMDHTATNDHTTTISSVVVLLLGFLESLSPHLILFLDSPDVLLRRIFWYGILYQLWLDFLLDPVLLSLP